MRAESWAAGAIARTTPTWPSGTYVDQYTFHPNGPIAYTAFGKWRGSPAAVASMYGDYSSWNTGGNGIENPQVLLGNWASTTWGANSGASLVLGVGLVPTGTAIPATASTYNANWATFATNLVAAGFGNCMIRPGWEFNGNWYPWAASTANATAWVAYWQQVYTTIKATAPNCKIIWNVNRGVSSGIADPTTVWPGAAYVDLIGVDAYDSYNPVNGGGWSGQLSGTQGLTYWLNYAVASSKPFCVPEWGLQISTGGGGDDPLYVTNMHSFFASCGTELAYEALWNAVTTSSFWPFSYTPQSVATYRSLWGH